MVLNATAQKIFKRKYAKSNETWERACIRVARHVSQDKPEALAKYFQFIHERVFLPGGRILSNAGTDASNLMNCFVLPIHDSRNSIFDTVKNSAEVLAQGGGVGYSFSSLREKGAKVGDRGNKSSGPVSFMEVFNSVASIIKMTSRRGAQMGILDISHPDIEEFIHAKGILAKVNSLLLNEYNKKIFDSDNQRRLLKELGYDVTEEDDTKKYREILEQILLNNQFNNFNISVSISNAFMEAVEEDGYWYLISPSTKETVKKVKAKKLLNSIAEQAWISGDPGVFFIDQANEDNMIPHMGDIVATNPCGEVPLLPYESCCLGSINLSKFYDKDTGLVDYEFLEYVVRTATRFLDDVVTVSISPLKESEEMSKVFRRIGLGVMGWADLLAKIGIPYDSKEAVKLAEYLSWFISFFAWLESVEIGKERGVDFTVTNSHVMDKVFGSDFVGSDVTFGEMSPRNVSVTSIAPTGTIALIAEVNSSIEPFFSLYYTRNLLSPEGGNLAEDTIIEINPILFNKMKALNYSSGDIKKVKNYIMDNGTLKDCPVVPKEFRDIFKTSHEIDWLDHVKMQEAWQSSTSNAVSKTINMPNDATVEQVRDAFIEMWKRNLKGGTIYRDGSKAFQVLNT